MAKSYDIARRHCEEDAPVKRVCMQQVDEIISAHLGELAQEKKMEKIHEAYQLVGKDFTEESFPRTQATLGRIYASHYEHLMTLDAEDAIKQDARVLWGYYVKTGETEQADKLKQILDAYLKERLVKKGNKVKIEGFELQVVEAKTMKSYTNPKQTEVRVQGDVLVLDKKVLKPEREDGYYVVVDLKIKNLLNTMEFFSKNNESPGDATIQLISREGVVFEDNTELADYLVRTPAHIYEIKTGGSLTSKMTYVAWGEEKKNLLLEVKEGEMVKYMEIF